jgi:hypothetical protein
MQSVASLVQSGVSPDTLRTDAKALTPTTNLFMIGTTQPYSANWRLGGDFRILNTSGTGAAGTQAAAPGSGNIYIYSAQAIGNNLLSKNDMGLVNASYTNAKSYKGWSLGLNGVEPLRQNWRLDMSLQYSGTNGSQTDTSYRQAKLTPSLKLAYRLNDSINFEAEGGIENTRTNSATQSDRSRRQYYYVGYRWDFR